MTERENQPEFDVFAPAYDQLVSDPVRGRFSADPLHFHRRKEIVLGQMLARAGASASGMSWLDVGCGRGELLALMGGQFAKACGCDLSARMLESAAGFDIHVLPGPLVLPFGDGTFDLITAVCVFHHVLEDERTGLIEEIRRVLRPGGLFCIVEHNPLNPVTRSIVKRCALDSEAVLLTAGEAARLARRSGFQSIDRRYFLCLPERLFRKARWVESALARIPAGGQYALLMRAAG